MGTSCSTAFKALELWHSHGPKEAQLYPSVMSYHVVPCRTMSYYFTWDLCIEAVTAFLTSSNEVRWPWGTTWHHMTPVSLFDTICTLISYQQLASTVINYHLLWTINYQYLSISILVLCAGSWSAFHVAQCMRHLRSAAQLQVGVGILYQSLAQTNSQPC